MIIRAICGVVYQWISMFHCWVVGLLFVLLGEVLPGVGCLGESFGFGFVIVVCVCIGIGWCLIVFPFVRDVVLWCEFLGEISGLV